MSKTLLVNSAPFIFVGWWLMPPRRRETQIPEHSDSECETSGCKSSLPKVLPPMDTDHSAGQMHLLASEELFVDILTSMNSECVCIWRQSLKRNYKGTGCGNTHWETVAQAVLSLLNLMPQSETLSQKVFSTKVNEIAREALIQAL